MPNQFQRGGVGRPGNRRAGDRGGQPRQQNELFTVVRLESEDTVLLRNSAGQEVSADCSALGVADQVLAIRPGAKFRGRIENTVDGRGRTRRKFKAAASPEAAFESYEPNVTLGLTPGGAAPDINRNPYNFIAWMGAGPFDAEKPGEGTHERYARNRLSGSIEAIFEACSPIYVPAGSEDESAEKSGFFKCWNGASERYAIPGSTVKGAVRSLFEALTNSRLGISDRENLGRKMLYRRRACQLFIITKVPIEQVDGEAVECQFCFMNDAGKVNVRLPEAVELQDPGLADGIVEWRANLFWVPKSAYSHRDGKSRIAYKKTSNTVTIRKEDYVLWRNMKEHPHFTEWHKKNVEANSNFKTLYNGQSPDFAKYGRDLFTLKNGQLLFGMSSIIMGRACLRPFGRNVNLLWTSAPLAELAEPYLARSEDTAGLDSSDPAEAAFGFIAKGRNSFRGRVRFGTFWLDPASPVQETSTVTLLPLASPSNARGKSRVLYLQPLPKSDQPPDPGTTGQLRGRKAYWHQKPHDQASLHGVPRQHCSDMILTPGPQPPVNNPPQTIEPLGKGARFRGIIQFSNLTGAELGALLGAINPSFLFPVPGREEPGYGIKLGKGKPRGLGSVRVIELTLTLLKRSIPERYRSLACTITTPAEPSDFIDAYKKWILQSRVKAGMKGGDFAGISAIKDIEALTKIPRLPSVRIYPPRFDQYAWNAGWCDAAGRPNDVAPAKPTTHRTRPKSMKTAGAR